MRRMAVYLFLHVNIFMKVRNLQLTSMERRPSVGFRPTSNVLYLKHIKLVYLYILLSAKIK